MPVITPSYPSMCSTFNITASNFKVIKKELYRGGQIADKIITGNGEWKDLFVKHTFFTKDYKYYLAVITASPTTEEQKLWAGKVESQVRHLIKSIDDYECVSIAHTFNKGFKRTNSCATEEQVDEVKNGSIAYKVEETVLTEINHSPTVKAALPDDTAASDTDASKPEEGQKDIMVYTDTFYIGLELHEGR
jgi:poly(A) polymerase